MFRALRKTATWSLYLRFLFNLTDVSSWCAICYRGDRDPTMPASITMPLAVFWNGRMWRRTVESRCVAQFAFVRACCQQWTLFSGIFTGEYRRRCMINLTEIWSIFCSLIQLTVWDLTRSVLKARKNHDAEERWKSRIRACDMKEIICFLIA